MLDRAKRPNPQTGTAEDVDQVELLKLARGAITNWRNDAAGVGVQLLQVNLAFVDGAPVVFEWDLSAEAWIITTGGQPAVPS